MKILHNLKNTLHAIKDDMDAVLDKDPAAKSRIEVLSYAGLHARTMHRVAHALWVHDYRVLARSLSQFARFATGIEIHPAAKIGKRLFIDHGMGVVIGETAEIGDDVTLYQGVTLGGVSLDDTKRHPTLQDGVVVGAGAKILGGFVVGKYAKVGSGAVVVKPVPAYATVVGTSARIIEKNTIQDGEKDVPAYALDKSLPNQPNIDDLLAKIDALEARLALLETQKS